MQSIITRKRKSLITLSTGIFMAASLLFTPLASAITIGGPSDCDSNAIIRCGAHSTRALMADYNSSAYVRKVFSYFGISNADMSSLPRTNVVGSVTSSGAVIVNGKTVANNAITGGRQDISGSTRVNFQGITFYKRPPSVSFQQSSLPAFVAMKNGVFQFAVIASCGNAVMAHPTSAPHKAAVGPARAVSTTHAKPQQKPQQFTPTQTQVQTQSQQVNVNNSSTQTFQTAPQTTTESTPAPETTATTSEQPATEQASKLVNTGPAGTIGVFLAATGLGMLGYRRFLLRRILG